MREQPFLSLIRHGLASAPRRNFVLQNITNIVIFSEASNPCIPWKRYAQEGGLSMNGQDLREARRKKGWTQGETAEKLGVTPALSSIPGPGRRPLPLYPPSRASATIPPPPHT